MRVNKTNHVIHWIVLIRWIALSRYRYPGARFSKAPVPSRARNHILISIKISRKVTEFVLISNEVHFVSLADKFTALFSKLLKLPSLKENKTFVKRASGSYTPRHAIFRDELKEFLRRLEALIKYYFIVIIIFLLSQTDISSSQ